MESIRCKVLEGYMQWRNIFKNQLMEPNHVYSYLNLNLSILSVRLKVNLSRFIKPGFSHVIEYNIFDFLSWAWTVWRRQWDCIQQVYLILISKEFVRLTTLWEFIRGFKVHECVVSLQAVNWKADHWDVIRIFFTHLLQIIAVRKQLCLRRN
jgi:hypothetical protein